MPKAKSQEKTKTPEVTKKSESTEKSIVSQEQLESVRARREALKITQRRNERISFPMLGINKGKWSDLPDEESKIGDFYLTESVKSAEGKYSRKFKHLGKKVKGTILATRNAYSRWNNDLGKNDIRSNEFDPSNPNYPILYKNGNEPVSDPIRAQDVKDFNIKMYPNVGMEDRGYGPSSQLKWSKVFYIMLEDFKDETGNNLVVKHITNYKSNEDWFAFDSSLDDIIESYILEIDSKKQVGKQTTYSTVFRKISDNGDDLKHSDESLVKVFQYKDDLEQVLLDTAAQWFRVPLTEVKTVDVKALSAPVAEVEDDIEEEVNIDDVNI